jgi:hypothetical protein
MRLPCLAGLPVTKRAVFNVAICLAARLRHGSRHGAFAKAEPDEMPDHLVGEAAVVDGWTAAGDGIIDRLALWPLCGETRADNLVEKHDNPAVGKHSPGGPSLHLQSVDRLSASVQSLRWCRAQGRCRPVAGCLGVAC